ncbi:MAG: response regulator [Campylobacterota bacterium]
MFNYEFLKKLDVLYIENDEQEKKHLTLMLAKQFGNVISFKTAHEALAKFKEDKAKDSQIDIVICDEKLDDKDGLKLLESIREIDDNIPVIMTTEEITSSLLLDAIKYQATDCLQKPINVKDLVFCVENACLNKYHKELREQNKKDLEDIIEVINQVALVIKTDPKGKITFVNEYFESTSKYKQDELLNQSYEILKDENTNKIVFEEIFEATNNGKIYETKLRFKTKQKEDFYVYLTVVPVFSRVTNKITELMWVSFLATDDELEQREFKKKVAKNLQENRHINLQARKKIDKLIGKLSFYRTIDVDLKTEDERERKFKSQIKFYEEELEEIDSKLKDTSKKASEKIKKIVTDERRARKSRDEAVVDLSVLSKDLNLKNKTIKELTKELDEHVSRINQLMSKINYKEYKLNNK